MVTLEEVTLMRAPIERCFDLARNVDVHLAGNVRHGETAVADGGVTSGLLGLGDQVTWRARHFGIWQQLTSRITAMERPLYFQDTMVSGAFRSLQHDHLFRALTPDLTEMREVFCFAAPCGILGRLAEILVLRRYMRKLLRERNDALCKVAEGRYLPHYFERF